MTDLILRQGKLGTGVFANRNFKKMQVIIKFNGSLFTYEQLPTPYDKVDDHYVQIGKDLFMGPSGGLDDFFNHSCDPNSGLRVEGRRAILIAIRKVQKGEEITWDYSTTMDEDDWEMDCACESTNCREKVRDFKFLPEDIQKKYIELGIVPRYILESLRTTRPI